MTSSFGSRRHAASKKQQQKSAPDDERDRALGALLVEAGRIDADALERILRAQRKKGVSFGRAGLSLGLLTQDDLDFVAARQSPPPFAASGGERVSPDVLAAFETPSPVVEQLRVLRNQLMVRWLNGAPGRRALAITGYGRGEGRSFIAANLAVLFAQINARTLLIDADLRHGCQASIFKLEGHTGLSDVLTGSADVDDVMVQITGSLSVLSAGSPASDPHELLCRPAFAEMLGALEERFDLMLVDTPASRGCADAFTVASSVGAALIVARRNLTPAGDLLRFARTLQGSGTQLLGSVLNDV